MKTKTDGVSKGPKVGVGVIVSDSVATPTCAAAKSAAALLTLTLTPTRTPMPTALGIPWGLSPLREILEDWTPNSEA